MPHEFSQTRKCKEQILREEYGNFDGGHYGSGRERTEPELSRVTKRVPSHGEYLSYRDSSSIPYRLPVYPRRLFTPNCSAGERELSMRLSAPRRPSSCPFPAFVL
jgi:hypothetical protein